jgi:hypothetical protein
MTKIYSSASNVRRAVKTAITKAGFEPISVVVTPVEGGFVGHLVFAAGTSDVSAFDDFEVRVIEGVLPESPEREAAKMPEFAQKILDEVGVAPKAPRDPKPAHVGESKAEKPVALVHRVCAEMVAANPAVTRKEILTALRGMGVATHTAATQYARWKSGKSPKRG